MTPAALKQRAQIVRQLALTNEAIERVLLSGLTTAGPATLKSLQVTFQEASRWGLMRLSSTLRNTCEEMAQYIQDDPAFSQQRLVFFLNRSWILCGGLESALRRDDADQLARLSWSPKLGPATTLQVVCLGVVEKIATDVFCTSIFDSATSPPSDHSTGQPYFP